MATSRVGKGAAGERMHFSRERNQFACLFVVGGGICEVLWKLLSSLPSWESLKQGAPYR